MTPIPTLERFLDTESPLRRRSFLAGGATAATVTLAGCSAVVDYLSGLVLDDVNVFNETQQRLGGSISVTSPAGDVVLDDEFSVAANTGNDDDENDEAMAQFGDVLDDEGNYGVTVQLNDGADVDGQESTETTVDVTAPDDEHLLVGLGVEDADEPISVIVIETLRDLEKHEES